MGEVRRIKTCSDSGYVLKINPRLSLGPGLDNQLKGHVSYGTQKCFVDIKRSPDVPENEINLSQPVIDHLHLPDYPDFEILMNGGGISIGPHLGLILTYKDELITKAVMNDASDFLSKYSALHGSVVLFTPDKIDTSRHMVDGYCFDYKTKNWVRGTFPYPLSIYARLYIMLDRDLKNHMLSVIGDTIFNNFFMDKYEMHNWLSNDPGLVPHLPHTVLYKCGQDVFHMLKRFGTVYVKPLDGECGRSVARISLEEGRIAIRYRQNKSNVEMFTQDSEQGMVFIERLLKPYIFAVQQSIDLLEYEGRHFDFRQVMQKDSHGKWICKCNIGRIAAADSVISNISNGGQAMRAADLFKKAMNLSGSEAAAMEEILNSLGFKICSVLDRQGINYGDLGIDIGIDKNNHPWIIEINSRTPDHRIAWFVNDMELYKDLMSTPLFYAKHLAGF